MGPAGMPADLVKRIHTAMMQAISAPDVQQRLKTYGLFAAPSSPEELVKFQTDETRMWAVPIKDSGFTGE